MKPCYRLLALFSLAVLCGLPVAQAVTCTDPTIPPSNPDSVYIVNSDGTVLDRRNGLLWKRCTEGQSGANCSGSATAHTWSAALSLAASSTFAGYSDWRLPNVKELKSLVEKCRRAPSINDVIFPATPSSDFWSGSPDAYYSDYAWLVGFVSGFVGSFSRGNGDQVRLVRGGQSFDTFDRLNDQSSALSVIEFYNTFLDNYFITASANEAAQIDRGSAGPGWIRTGYSFKSGGSTPVCRFYGSQSPGPNSHFYTLAGSECDGLKQVQASTPATQKRWNFESLDFVSSAPFSGVCPTGTLPVYRAYNNGYARGVDSNHRIASNPNALQEVVARGWINEGVVMCAPM